jgi:hypothetical protein
MPKSSFFALNVTFFSKIYGKKMHIYIEFLEGFSIKDLPWKN